MRSSLRRAVVLAVAALLALAGPVAATNWGSNHASAGTPAHPCDTTIYSQCVAEVNTVPIEWGLSLSQAHKDAINFVISYYDANTAIYPYLSGLPADRVTTVLDTNAGRNGAWAWGQCAAGATYGGSDPYRWCRPSRLYWNTYYEASNYPTTTNKRAVACHEVGHLGGLRHSTNSSGSCMYIAPSTVTNPDSHDRSMLAAYY